MEIIYAALSGRRWVVLVLSIFPRRRPFFKIYPKATSLQDSTSGSDMIGFQPENLMQKITK